MTTTVFKNEEKVSTKEVLDTFRKRLENDYEKSFDKSEIEQLVDIASKNPTDKFVVTDYPDTLVMQGDLLIWSNLTSEYREALKTLSDLKPTKNMILQETDSITGDHRLILLPETDYTLETGKFQITIGAFKKAHTCRILKTNKPFLIFHREHGNLTLPAGEYLVCSSLDAKTLDRMID